MAGSDTEIRIPIDVAALPNSIIGADDAAFLLTRDEARRIAANIAKLPEAAARLRYSLKPFDIDQRSLPFVLS